MHHESHLTATTIHSIDSTDRLLVSLYWFLLGLSILIPCTAVSAVEPGEPLDMRGRHPLYHKALPPGAVWQSPAAVTMHTSTFQPVQFSGPEGTRFSLAENGVHSEGEKDLMAGLMVGAVYRFRVTDIPRTYGAEVYPTVELIGRIYPPPGMETSFPIPINLSQSDLQEALAGNLVTRVIYLEDPQTAAPLARSRDDATAIDIPLDQDALATADSLGRPVAILRIGSKAPPRNPVLAPQFYFGFPPWAPIHRVDEATSAQ